MDLLITQVITKIGGTESKLVFKNHSMVDFIPRVGEYISDEAFLEKSEYKVLNITLDYESNLCSSMLESNTIKANDERTLDECIDYYLSCGWRI